MTSPRTPRLLLLGLVLATFALRWALAASGGQYFFGDEQRYDRGVKLYQSLLAGDWSTVRGLAILPEHALFQPLVAAVTAVQHGLAQFTAYGDWSQPQHVIFTMWLGAGVLGLFGALNVLLVHRLARLAGASATEALWASTLLAAANTPLCYARHLLPYECALSAALAGLALGLGGTGRARLFASGLLAGFAAGLYNGYWFLVPTVWLTLVWWRRADPARVALALISGAGAAVGVLGPVALGAWLGGDYYWSLLRDFSQSVTQGLFAEGWSLPGEFLWASEGLFGLALLALIVAALLLARRAPSGVPARVALWAVALGLAYGLLVLFSVGLGRFVVYGRTVLALVPVLCLLGGWAIARLAGDLRWRSAAALAVVALAALAHARFHLELLFPRDVEISVLRHYGNPKRTFSLSGSIYLPYAAPVTRPELILVNAQLLYPLRDSLGYPPGRPLLDLPHPLAYPVFQYDGHTPRERALLRTHGISLRLIQLADPAAWPDHPPAAICYGPADRPSGR